MNQYTSVIVMAIFGSAVVPWVIDMFWATRIWIINKKKGKPTFLPGSRYAGLLFPSGYVFPECTVLTVDFGTVTFVVNKRDKEAYSHSDRPTVTVKKSHLATGKVTPFRYFKHLV